MRRTQVIDRGCSHGEFSRVLYPSYMGVDATSPQSMLKTLSGKHAKDLLTLKTLLPGHGVIIGTLRNTFHTHG
jgi:hypothetical protein